MPFIPAPEFRVATTSDEQTLIGFMADFYREEHLPFDADRSRSSLGTLLTAPQLGEVRIIVSEQEIAGYFVLTFGFSLEFGGRDALLDELYVRPSFRGRGLGRQTLEFVTLRCQQQGIAALHLQVIFENDRARLLYERAGFRTHRRHLMTKWVTA